MKVSIYCILASYAQPAVALRLASYPPCSPDPDCPADNISAGLRYGAHTDYTGFTILWPDPHIGGLEVFIPDSSSASEQGQWVACPPRPGAFVVNAGDLIQRWTNDHWVSNLHRVVSSRPSSNSMSSGPSGAAPENHERARLSLVYFTGPNFATVCECLPSPLCSPQAPQYPPVTAGAHLRAKVTPTALEKS